jgi:KDO2-lipid IV(A) lauroyltransferase
MEIGIRRRGRVLVMLLAQLPLSFVLGFARVVGCLVFWLWPSRRRVAVENLLRTGVAGTRAEALRLGRASFESFVMLIVESIVARDPKRLVRWDEMVELDVSPEVRALLEEPGRGLIVASAHLGNWEVAARAVSRIKPMCVLYRPVKNPELNAFLHAGRSGENLRYVSRLESDPRRFLVALSQGEIVALMMDQFVHSGRVEVEFLGQPTWTSRSVAMLHMTTRAPLLVAVAVRIGPMKYRVHGLGPIQYTRSGDRETDVRTLMQSVSAEIETLVRRYPDQYLWGHRRWKSHDT